MLGAYFVGTKLNIALISLVFHWFLINFNVVLFSSDKTPDDASFYCFLIKNFHEARPLGL